MSDEISNDKLDDIYWRVEKKINYGHVTLAGELFADELKKAGYKVIKTKDHK